MPRPNVQKAKFINLNRRQEVECHFNPDQFDITKTVGWTKKPSIGNDASELVFSGGEGQTFTIPLLFDTTSTGQDVRREYKALFAMILTDKREKDPKTKQSEPPMCRFQWGRFLSFDAVIEQISQKFTMFKPDGTPLRAEVSVTLKEVAAKPAGQNPSTRSEARKTWVVQEGQRLDWIAFQEYGDSAQWRHIAETNNLDNPDALRTGQILKLVPLT